MSLDFDGSSDPSLGGSNSDDYGMEENRLSNLEGLPQASWRSGSSEQVQKENSAMSLLTDAAPLRFLDSYVTSVLPTELQSFPWTMNRSDLLELEVDDDCISEAATSSVAEQNSKTLVWNPVVSKSSFSLQILADRVMNSIENLQVFYEFFSKMAGLGEEGYGDSENLPLAKKQKRFSPPLPSAKLGDSLPRFQICNHGRQFRVARLDASSENHISGRPVAYGKNAHQEYWQWMSQTTQENLTEGRLWGIKEGGESKSSGEKGSGPKADLDDLLSSLRYLLSVLKNHEETEQILRTKLQLLRERKEALHLQKQQYKDKHKRQRVLQS